MVGVSGGKDSLALLEVLAMRAKDPKQNYTVIAAHIAVEDVAYEVDGEYLREFCERLGVEYVYRTIRVDTTVNPKKPACFVCSWHRRKMLFDIEMCIRDSYGTLGCGVTLFHVQVDVAYIIPETDSFLKNTWQVALSVNL